MIRGFVLGKFMPLHQGHLALIRFALTQCDFLTIIVCFTRNEPIEGVIRKQWLYEELEGVKNISIRSFPYNDEDLANTSVSSRDVSLKWAEALKPVVPDASLVFTSEPYGEYLAAYMGITHIPFDPQRNKFQVSASAIRKDPFLCWDYIAKAAQPFYVKKIFLLGSESTGKSTLTEKLANNFPPVLFRRWLVKYWRKLRTVPPHTSWRLPPFMPGPLVRKPVWLTGCLLLIPISRSLNPIPGICLKQISSLMTGSGKPIKGICIFSWKQIALLCRMAQDWMKQKEINSVFIIRNSSGKKILSIFQSEVAGRTGLLP